MDFANPKPLAAARERLERAAWAAKAGKPELADNPDIILGMAAAGVSQDKIAASLGVSRSVVRRAIEPQLEMIGTIRERLKVSKMVHMEKVEAQMWPRILREMDKGDAKDIDALSRAAHAMEKIQAQVSGEGMKMDVKGTVTSETPNIDLKALINIVLNEH